MKIYKFFVCSFFVLVFGTSFLYSQKPPFPQIDGWKTGVEAQVYDANNLWDLIDGAADLFLEYSFADLKLARFTNSSGIEIKAELYRHADNLNAFGMYSQERDPSNHFINAGLQGYIEEGVLNFVDGEYYIKLSTLQKGKEAQDALLLIAGQIEKSLNRTNSLPAVLKYFPADSKVTNSEKFISQNFLGYGFLKSAMTLKYGTENPLTAFIIETAGINETTKILDEFKKLTDVKLEKYPDRELYSFTNQGGEFVLFSPVKNYICGVCDSKDKALAEKFIGSLTALLK
jgi:hypothetical protein